MKALTNEPCEIGFRCENGKLAVDLRLWPGEVPQDEKNDLAVWANERIQKFSYFRIRLEAVGAATQQSASRQVPDASEGKTELGPEVSQMLKRLTDEPATMVQLAVWAYAGSDGRCREEAETQWQESEGPKVA
jgi:hypothetical protein